MLPGWYCQCFLAIKTVGASRHSCLRPRALRLATAAPAPIPAAAAAAVAASWRLLAASRGTELGTWRMQAWVLRGSHGAREEGRANWSCTRCEQKCVAMCEQPSFSTPASPKDQPMPRPDSSPASSTRSRDRAKTCPPPTSKSNDVSHIQELEKLRDAPILKNPISKGRLAQRQSDQQTMQMAAGRVSERLVFETCIFAFACARSGACSSSPQLNGGPPRAGQEIFDPDFPSVTSTALLAMKPVRMWCPAASMKEPPREVVSHPCHRDSGPGVDMRIFVSVVIQGPGRSTCMGSGERWRAGGETGTPGVVQKEAWPRG